MTDTAETTTETGDEVLIVTESARATVFDIRSKEDDSDAHGINA
jgi:hypothetical protein